jgi:hypothetical protein
MRDVAAVAIAYGWPPRLLSRSHVCSCAGGFGLALASRGRPWSEMSNLWFLDLFGRRVFVRTAFSDVFYVCSWFRSLRISRPFLAQTSQMTDVLCQAPYITHRDFFE